MKRGNKLLRYVLSITFCCLVSLFFVSGKVDAFSYSCIDKTKEDNFELDIYCDALTDYDNAYYRLDSIEISDIVEVNGEKKLVIPSTYTENGIELNVRVIGNNTTPLLSYDLENTIDKLVLNENVKVISSYSLSGFSHIGEIIIPKYMERINANIFANNASVDKIYFNAYKFGTGYDDYIYINDNAFEAGVVDMVICEDHEIYNYYTNHYKNLKYNVIVTKVTYNYYPHENTTVPLDSIDYYVAERSIIGENDLYEEVSVTGLTFNGWKVKNESTCDKLVAGGQFCFVLRTKEYSIYPDYTLNPLTNLKGTYGENGANKAVIENNSLELEYDGKIRYLSVSYDMPTIASVNVRWTKAGETVYPSFANVDDSGVYQVTVISTYEYEGTKYTTEQPLSLNIVIKKKALLLEVEKVSQIYGEGLNSSNCSYKLTGNLETHTFLVTSCSYLNTVLNGTKVKVNVGDYSGVISMDIIAIKDSENGLNLKDNYDITYKAGDYSVTQKDIPAIYTGNLEVTYGESFVISNSYTDPDTLEKITIIYTKNGGLNVGQYGVESAHSSNPNYRARFNKEASTGTIIIIPAMVEVKPSLANNVYTGTAKEIKFIYKDVVTNSDRELEFVVYKDGEVVEEVINAGKYVAKVVTLDDKNHYIKDHVNLASNPYEYHFEVLKAAPKILAKSPQEVTYTGHKISPHASVDNNEQVIQYTCLYGNAEDKNGCTNRGIYSVKISVAETDNYEAASKTIELRVLQRILPIDPKEFTFYYKDPISAKEQITIDNGDGKIDVINVVYTVAPLTSGDEYLPGYYAITYASARRADNAGDAENYVVSINTNETTKKIKVVARPVKIVYFDYTGLVYNGKVRSIGARAVDVANKKVVDIDVITLCDEGEIKDAKTYHVRAIVNDSRYEVVNSNLLVFEIAKATYDVSHIKFNNKNVVLNFAQHSISIQGELPSGLTVEYTIDGEKGNSTSKGFAHVVVAKFIGDANYHPVDDMQATIYVDVSWLFITSAILVLFIGVGISALILYAKYRREHPKKIKLKIRHLVEEDLAAKRVATSVEEVLGDEEKEYELLENEDDIIDENAISQNFIDRIYAADSELKYYYSEVKNEILSYSGITHTVDRKFEVFYHGTRQIAKLSICNNVLRLYVNLDPDKYDKSQYHHRDMSKIDCHARTPLRIDVNTTESLRHAKVFVRILRKKENLKTVTSFVRIDYEKFYTLKENIFPKIFKKMFDGKKTKGKK